MVGIAKGNYNGKRWVATESGVSVLDDKTSAFFGQKPFL